MRPRLSDVSGSTTLLLASQPSTAVLSANSAWPRRGRWRWACGEPTIPLRKIEGEAMYFHHGYPRFKLLRTCCARSAASVSCRGSVSRKVGEPSAVALQTPRVKGVRGRAKNALKGFPRASGVEQDGFSPSLRRRRVRRRRRSRHHATSRGSLQLDAAAENVAHVYVNRV